MIGSSAGMSRFATKEMENTFMEMRTARLLLSKNWDCETTHRTVDRDSPRECHWSRSPDHRLRMRMGAYSMGVLSNKPPSPYLG